MIDGGDPGDIWGSPHDGFPIWIELTLESLSEIHGMSVWLGVHQHVRPKTAILYVDGTNSQSFEFPDDSYWHDITLTPVVGTVLRIEITDEHSSTQNGNIDLGEVIVKGYPIGSMIPAPVMHLLISWF